MDLNTCFETTQIYHTIAYYSHLVPAALALFLGIYALIKTKYSKLSVVFFAFTVSVSLWLIGDVIVWTSSDYYKVYFTWSWLDYINILFFIFGAYFFGLIGRDKITVWEKIILGVLALPAFIITISGNSVLNFYHPVCEATNNPWLTQYKLIAEGVVVLLMFYQLFISWKKATHEKRIQLITVFSAILLFFIIFSSTEYISSITGVYETNLYSLFILPVFMIVMVFAITNLGIFAFRFLGTQIVAYVLIIMVSSQFLYIQDSTDKGLSFLTLGVALVLGYLLLQNSKRELEQREQIESLAQNLRGVNRIMSHDIKNVLGKNKDIFLESLHGTFGPIGENAKPMFQLAYDDTTKLLHGIMTILQSGQEVSINKAEFDMREALNETIKIVRADAEKKNLKLELEAEEGDYKIKGDKNLLMVQVLENVIENSIHYTLNGSISVSLSKTKNTAKQDAILLKVKDTGIGISSEDKKKLFTEGGHGKDSLKVNVHSTGYGLYIAKKIVDAHGGRIWAESEGIGHGSTFFVELPA